MGWEICDSGTRVGGFGMKIIFTGATGFVRRHVVPELQGYKPLQCYNFIYLRNKIGKTKIIVRMIR